MENFYVEKEVKNYCIQGENPNYNLHNFDVPFRSLVIAPSGSGKSTHLITLFCKGNEGTFDNIYIF
jgi:ABC-type lipoprotein export system ATPase subunit